MKNVLLLGGNGFIGKNLQFLLQQNNISFKISDITYDNNLKIDLSNNKEIFKLVDVMKDITDIVVLACTVGTKKYINDPFESYLNSINIINNIIELLDISFKKFKKKYNIIFFSSSDVYIKTNSIDSYITENTPINIITTRNIALYGAVKIIGEILFEKLYAQNKILSLKILRPFNISGKYQYQGLIYEMLNDIKYKNKIFFAENTTRVITSISFLCDNFLEILNSKDTHIIKNIADKNGSVSLDFLALNIKKILETYFGYKNIELISLKNNSAEYRHVSKVNNEQNITKLLIDIIKDIL